MNKTTRAAVSFMALGAVCAGAHAEVIQYNCGSKGPLPHLVLDYSADGKTVTIMNDGGKFIVKGRMLTRDKETGVDYVDRADVNFARQPLIALRLTGESRDKVALKAGRIGHYCNRI